MKVIYKYKLSVDSEMSGDSIELPENAEILHAAIDPKTQALTLWAMIDPDKPKVKRAFVVIGTGWKIANPETLTHINTVIEHNGLVWHVFEVM